MRGEYYFRFKERSSDVYTKAVEFTQIIYCQECGQQEYEAQVKSAKSQVKLLLTIFPFAVGFIFAVWFIWGIINVW